MIDYVASAIEKRLPLGAELQVALNLIPAHTWYAVPSGALTFLNIWRSYTRKIGRSSHKQFRMTWFVTRTRA